MKTVYIINNDSKITIPKLTESIKKHSDALDLVGSGPVSENTFKEVGMTHPDFAVVPALDASASETILRLSPKTRLIQLVNDTNRAADTESQLEKDGFEGTVFFNIDEFSPDDVVSSISEDASTEQDAAPSSSEDEDDGSALDSLLEKGDSEANAVKEKDVLKAAEEQKKTEAEAKELEEKEASGIKARKKIDLLDLKSKFITVYSKKGGTGCTTLAKEMSFVYGNIALPKKLNYSEKYLRVCLVDLDFEEGEVRTMLGIENPNPNIYLWIDDILTRLEKGTPIEKIGYDRFQILTRFVKHVDKGLYCLCTYQGGIPKRTYDKIVTLDKTADQSLFKSIMKLILRSLKKAFDIIVCDTASSFDETSLTAMELSDTIVYPVCPTVSDLDCLKTSVAELSQYDKVDLSNLLVVMNKRFKNNGLDDTTDDIMASISYKSFDYEANSMIDVPVKIRLSIPFTFDVQRAENGFQFACEKNAAFKNAVVSLDGAILPIFKVKSTQSMRLLTEKERERIHEEDARKLKKKEAWEKRHHKGASAPDAAVQKEGGAEAGKTAEKPQKAPLFKPEDLKKARKAADLVKLFASSPEVRKTKAGFPVVPGKPAGARFFAWHGYVSLRNEAIHKDVALMKEQKTSDPSKPLPGAKPTAKPEAKQEEGDFEKTPEVPEAPIDLKK